MDKKKQAATKEQAENGHELSEATEIVPATPEMRIMLYKARLGQLEAELQVQIRPFIKTYNDGRQVAEIELVALD